MLRRFILMIVGFGLGLVAFGAAEVFLVQLPIDRDLTNRINEAGPQWVPPAFYQDGRPMALAYMAAFATLLAVLRWWLDANPMRSTRLSLWSLLVTVVFAHHRRHGVAVPRAVADDGCRLHVGLRATFQPLGAGLRPFASATEKNGIGEEDYNGRIRSSTNDGGPTLPDRIDGPALLAWHRTSPLPHTPSVDWPDSSRLRGGRIFRFHGCSARGYGPATGAIGRDSGSTGLRLFPGRARAEQPARPVAVTPDRVQTHGWSPPEPPPPPREISVVETRQPKMNVLAALRQAVVQYWTGRGSPVVAEAPEKPAKSNQAVRTAKAQPPSWVNAPPKLENNCYRMSVRTGPYTTLLECQRELRKSLQGAVAEYAELSFGPEAAAVRLPDSDLQHLVCDRWNEVRPMEIGGSSQDMVTLHALLVFDAPAQQRIKAEVEQIKTEVQRLMIDQRVHGAALVFGGVIGLLALTWGGLKWTTRRA